MGKRILIADASAFSRGMIRSGLDMAGYQIVEAANLDQAVCRLEQQAVDLLIIDRRLTTGDPSVLLKSLRQQPDCLHIPVLAVVDSAEDLRNFDRDSTGFHDCHLKYDKMAILESVAQLVASTPTAEPALV
jgi:CheY-like chemotaxis protein